MKSTKTFGVRFIIRTHKNDLQHGLVYARITVDGKRIEISLKRTIDPELWDSRAGCVKGNKDAARQLNPYIDDVRCKLTEGYRQLQLQNKVITAAAIQVTFLKKSRTMTIWILRTIVYHLLRTKVYQLFRSKVYQCPGYVLLDFAAKYTTRFQVSV